MTEPSLEHVVHKKDSSSSILYFFDVTDVLVLGITYMVMKELAPRVTDGIGIQALTAVALGVAYFITSAVKKKLEPYPKVVQHVIDWYGKPDVYEIQSDPKPVPLFLRPPKIEDL
jgi:hypothetical protein